ncbi:transglutaminase-like domain-containing protein, partial [Akkermansiaceae bacterium]|nr:transglutaminase-like domain-containing protein [Akkermansiaceae bacterium]
PPLPADKTIHRYPASSTLGTFDTIPDEASFEPAIEPRPEYLQLPKNDLLRQRLDNLAATFTGTPRESLKNLRSYLSKNCTYSLEVETPEGRDPLEDFLFGSRQGYCTHFSSASALLARALGFPSRIAFGWSGGRYYASPNFYVFRGREAHAWTEIHLKDHGWVIFDTTPISRTEGTPSVADQNEDSPLDFSDLEGEDLAVAPLAPLKSIALWIGSASLVIFALSLIARRPKQKDAATSSAISFLLPPPNYLTLFKRACSAHGFPMPAGRTLRSHLDLIPAPAFTAELLDYHYAVQYADAPRDKKREKQFSQQLRQWEKERFSDSF